jgi:hypothetical protein
MVAVGIQIDGEFPLISKKRLKIRKISGRIPVNASKTEEI